MAPAAGTALPWRRWASATRGRSCVHGIDDTRGWDRGGLSLYLASNPKSRAPNPKGATLCFRCFRAEVELDLALRLGEVTTPPPLKTVWRSWCCGRTRAVS